MAKLRNAQANMRETIFRLICVRWHFDWHYFHHFLILGIFGPFGSFYSYYFVFSFGTANNFSYSVLFLVQIMNNSSTCQFIDKNCVFDNTKKCLPKQNLNTTLCCENLPFAVDGLKILFPQMFCVFIFFDWKKSDNRKTTWNIYGNADSKTQEKK